MSNDSPTLTARRAVVEMLANGAVFHVPRRADSLQSFTYELRGGGDRQRCRAIIRDAKEAGGEFWAAFVQAIVEIAGEPAP
jgi:hypothetical protein